MAVGSAANVQTDIIPVSVEDHPRLTTRPFPDPLRTGVNHRLIISNGRQAGSSDYCPGNAEVDGVIEPYSEVTIKKYRLKDEKGYYRLCGRGIKGSPIQSAKDVDPSWEKTHPELVVRNYIGKGYPPSDYLLIDIENSFNYALLFFIQQHVCISSISKDQG